MSEGKISDKKLDNLQKEIDKEKEADAKVKKEAIEVIAKAKGKDENTITESELRMYLGKLAIYRSKWRKHNLVMGYKCYVPCPTDPLCQCRDPYTSSIRCAIKIPKKICCYCYKYRAEKVDD